MLIFSILIICCFLLCLWNYQINNVLCLLILILDLFQLLFFLIHWLKINTFLVDRNLLFYYMLMKKDQDDNGDNEGFFFTHTYDDESILNETDDLTVGDRRCHKWTAAQSHWDFTDCNWFQIFIERQAFESGSLMTPNKLYTKCIHCSVTGTVR